MIKKIKKLSAMLLICVFALSTTLQVFAADYHKNFTVSVTWNGKTVGTVVVWYEYEYISSQKYVDIYANGYEEELVNLQEGYHCNTVWSSQDGYKTIHMLVYNDYATGSNVGTVTDNIIVLTVSSSGATSIKNTPVKYQ